MTMEKVTYGTQPFFESLEMSIESLLNKFSLKETFDWNLPGILGYRAWVEDETIKIEIKSGE